MSGHESQEKIIQSGRRLATALQRVSVLLPVFFPAQNHTRSDHQVQLHPTRESLPAAILGTQPIFIGCFDTILQS